MLVFVDLSLLARLAVAVLLPAVLQKPGVVPRILQFLHAQGFAPLAAKVDRLDTDQVCFCAVVSVTRSLSTAWGWDRRARMWPLGLGAQAKPK
jgi:hypothetical protein